mmetsp:Transcript_98495/g.256650  ORF Transcript_98495/g.256650 Transcript_98495/m.256650 type:complete len:220 (+) Transcript_98495:236-895(+)
MPSSSSTSSSCRGASGSSASSSESNSGRARRLLRMVAASTCCTRRMGTASRGLSKSVSMSSGSPCMPIACLCPLSKTSKSVPRGGERAPSKSMAGSPAEIGSICATMCAGGWLGSVSGVTCAEDAADEGARVEAPSSESSAPSALARARGGGVKAKGAAGPPIGAVATGARSGTGGSNQDFGHSGKMWFTQISAGSDGKAQSRGRHISPMSTVRLYEEG